MMLVSVEGIDGSGTRTQARALVEQLRLRGIKAHLTAEPTNSPAGRLIRALLAEGSPHTEKELTDGADDATRMAPVDPWALALIFAADRRLHQKEIQEHLDAGEVVVTCRYISSSLAYQGAMIELQSHGKPTGMP